ncbi:unnamed protein product [Absidia cylindrospora]
MSAILDKPIQITANFTNYRFFEIHLPRDWNFKNFVIWKGHRLPLPPNVSAKQLLREYHDCLNTLLKKKLLPDALQNYVGVLKNNAKRTDRTLLELQDQPAAVTINAENVISGNVYGEVSQTVQRLPSSSPSPPPPPTPSTSYAPSPQPSTSYAPPPPQSQPPTSYAPSPQPSTSYAPPPPQSQPPTSTQQQHSQDQETDDIDLQELVAYQTHHQSLLFAWAYLLEADNKTELATFLNINTHNINDLISNTADTASRKLDQGAAKLLQRYSELENDDILHLRLLLSRIVNTMSPSLAQRTKQLLGRDLFENLTCLSLERYSDEPLDEDISSMYDTIIDMYQEEGPDDTDIFICTTKIGLIKNKPRSSQLIALKALEFVLTHLPSWMKPGKTSEADHYGRVCGLFEIIFMDTDIKLTSGDTASTTTKSFRTLHEKQFGFNAKNTIRGRKIDGIIGHKDLELSLSECKPATGTSGTLIKQLVKNLRSNACIHRNLQSLSPTDEEVEVYGLDWHGNHGVLYMLYDVDDVLVVSKLGDLVIPLEPYDLATFKDTISLLLNLKECLKKQLKKFRPLHLKRKRDFHCALNDASPPSSPFTAHSSNPLIYFSPAKKGHQ